MMRKKIVSLCMALVLCLSLLPVTALAAEEGSSTVYVGGEALTGSAESPAYATTDAATGAVTAQPTFTEADGWNIKWDGTTLTLRNATIQQAKEYSDQEKIAVYRASGNLNLALVGENTVDALGGGSAASCGINLGNGSLTISGEDGASLLVYGGDTTNTTKSNSCGIYARGTITIDSGTVTATGESASAASYGIYARGTITINSGTVTATGESASGDSYGICASGAVTINGGSVTATSGEAGGNSCGIYASNSVTIEDGTVNATSGKAGGNSVGIYTLNSVTINGGDVTATAGDAVGSSYGINTANISTSITVNGGTVTATSGEAKGDSCAIFAESQINADDASSSVTINGGTVTARAGNAVGSGWYSCGIKIEGFLTITDGTVTATAADAVGTGTNKASIGIFSFKNVTISGGDVTGIGGTGELSWGIACNDILTIEGGTVVGKGGPLAGANIQYSGGINGMGEVKISGGTVTGTGGDTEVGNSFGICAGDTTSYNVVTVSIKDAAVTATGGTAASGNSSGISATNTIADVEVTIENAAVTTTGGSAGTGNSYGILAETTDTDKSAEVTINGNSVVRANMTGEEGVDGKTISGKTIERENGIVFENGEGTVYGTVTLQENLTVDAGESLTIPQDATLLIPENVTLTNRGTMTNNGTINNRGTLTIEPGGNLAGSGTVTGNSVEWPYTPPPANPNYRIDVTTTEGGTVTKDPAAAKAGETVTLTPAPDAGYEVGDVTVTDRFGDAVEVTEQADGTYTFTMPNGQVSVNVTFVEVQPEPLPFTDVNEGDWFHDAVQYVYDNGLMDGVGDGHFAPNATTNRAMVVTILYRLAGEPDVSGDAAFTDVAPGLWYSTAVAWAAEKGIANGISETEFAPGNNLTREQLATVLYRYAQDQGYDVSASADLSGYPDAGQIQSWAQDAMTWAVAEGLLQGFEDDSLQPGGTATRAQIATILMRFLAAAPTA